MEKLKDPSMIVGTVALVSSLGSTFYFYHEIENMKKELTVISTTLNTLSAKVARSEKLDVGRTEVLQTLDNRIGELARRIDQLPTYDEHVDTREDIDELVASLRDNNIDVVLPSQGGPQSARSSRDSRRGSRGTPTARYQSDREDDGRRSRVPGSNRPSDHGSRRPIPRHEPSIQREHTSGRYMTKMPPDGHNDNIDDHEIINLVRQQAP